MITEKQSISSFNFVSQVSYLRDIKLRKYQKMVERWIKPYNLQTPFTQNEVQSEGSDGNLAGCIREVCKGFPWLIAVKIFSSNQTDYISMRESPFLRENVESTDHLSSDIWSWAVFCSGASVWVSWKRMNFHGRLRSPAGELIHFSTESFFTQAIHPH